MKSISATPSSLLRVHELKIDQATYEVKLKGSKQFELRPADRDFRIDDSLLLRVVTSDGQHTGDWLLDRVVYILSGEGQGLQPGYTAMGTKFITYGSKDDWKSFHSIKSGIIPVVDSK